MFGFIDEMQEVCWRCAHAKIENDGEGIALVCYCERSDQYGQDDPTCCEFYVKGEPEDITDDP